MVQLFKQKVKANGEEALRLNKLAIKLKKEIISGKIHSVSTDEVDSAIIPALVALRKKNS